MRRRVFLSVLASAVLSACASLTPATFPAERTQAVDAAIDAVIQDHRMPGAVYHLERQGRVYQHAYGHQTYDAAAPAITADTVFDIASLSKVVSTAPSVLILAQEGKLDLDAPLVRYLPDCGAGGKQGVTLRHLLTHSSGLPSGLPKTPLWHGREAAHQLACAQKLTDAPGTLFRYSDVNFILLGLIVEKVSGMPLEQFAQQRIFAPLGMRHTTYRPLQHIDKAAIAPTQFASATAAPESLHGDMRPGQTLQGEVHDPTARRMDGVAGSAGVFSTAGDLARYARMLLNDGELDGVRVLTPESVRLLTTSQSPAAMAAVRGMGMDIDSPYSRPRGSVYPVGSFGHTGFTGCILWVDPLSRSFYVFLSNRVYPDDKANIVPLYSQLGTLSAQAALSP